MSVSSIAPQGFNLSKLKPERWFLLCGIPLMLIYMSMLFVLTNHRHHGVERFLHVMAYAQTLRGEAGKMPAGAIAIAKQTAPYKVFRNSFGDQWPLWKKELAEQGYPEIPRMRIPKHPLERYRSLRTIPLDPDITVTFHTAQLPPIYPAIGYLPYIIGAFIGLALGAAPLLIVYLMIVSNVIVTMTLGYWVIRITPIMKWLFLFIMLVPYMCISRIYIMPDVLCIQLSMLLIAAVLHLYSQPRMIGLALQAGFIALASVIAVIKIVYCFMAGFLLLLPKRCFANSRRWYLFIALAAFITLLSAAGWNANIMHQFNVNPLDENVTKNETSSFLAQWQVMISQPVAYTLTTFSGFFQDEMLNKWLGGIFFWNRYEQQKMAQVMGLTWIGLLALFALTAFPYREQNLALTWQQRSISAALFVLGVFCIITIFFLAFTQVDFYPRDMDGTDPAAVLWYFQGRYLLPALPLLLFAFYRPKVVERLNTSLSGAVLLISVVVWAAMHGLILLK